MKNATKKAIICAVCICTLSLTGILLEQNRATSYEIQEEDQRITIGGKDIGRHITIALDGKDTYIQSMVSRHTKREYIEYAPSQTFTTTNEEPLKTATERIHTRSCYVTEQNINGENYLDIFVPETYFEHGKKIETESIDIDIYIKRETDSYLQQHLQTVQPTGNNMDTQDQVGYLIITTEPLYQSLADSFVAWKIANDDKINTIQLINVSEINNNPATWVHGAYGDATNAANGNPFIPNGTEVTTSHELFNDTQCHIRNYIRYMVHIYNTSYVLLAGNNQEIPSRLVEMHAHSGPTGSWNNYTEKPSDMYYTNLEYCWDNNTNGVWAEYHFKNVSYINGGNGVSEYDQIDWSIDVSIGRVLANTAQEMLNWINKTKAYVDGDTQGNYLKNMLVASQDADYNIDDGVWNMIGDEFPQNISFLNGQNISEPQFNNIDRYCNGVESGWDGFTLIHHSGHSHTHSGTLWDVYRPTLLNNTHIPNFVYSEGCHAGDFSASISCIEDWIQDDACAYAAISNSCWGWFVASTWYGEEMFGILFNESYYGINISTFATAHYLSKMFVPAETHPVCPMIIKETNFFGDPALEYQWHQPTTGMEPEFGSPSPANGTVELPICLNWQIPITDPKGTLFDWTISCNDGSSSNGTQDTNGTKTLSLADLTYNTTYTVSVSASNGNYTKTREYIFTTSEQPPKPENFTALGISPSKINLSWTKNGDRTIIICNQTQHPPTMSNGTEVANTTASIWAHDGLQEGSTYYYAAWSYDNTTKSFSEDCIRTQATTQSNNQPIISDESPTNNSTDISIEGINLIATLSDPEGDVMDWTIETTPSIGSNSGSTTATTVMCPIGTLQYNTTYTWHINVTDGYGWTNATYSFTTEDEQLPPLTITNISPPQGANNVSLYYPENVTIISSEETYGFNAIYNWSMDMENNGVIDGYDVENLSEYYGMSGPYNGWIKQDIVKDAQIDMWDLSSMSSYASVDPYALYVSADIENYTTIEIYSNTTGSWQPLNANYTDEYYGNISDPGTVRNMFPFDEIHNGTTYWWRLCVSNETTWVNNTYSFTTMEQEENILPAINGEDPINGSTDVNYKYDQITVTLSDENADLMDYSIEGTYITNAVGTNVGNGTYSTSLITPLPYNTTVTWHINVTDGYGWTNETYSFTTEDDVVEVPTDLTAVSTMPYEIEVSWTPQEDYTYIRYSTSHYPTNRSDGELLYNGTGSVYTHTNTEGEVFYAAWSYDQSLQTYSTANNVYGMTTISAAPIQFNPQPADSNTNISINQSTVSISLGDTGPNSMQYTIEGKHINNIEENGVGNNTYNATIQNPLPYNTNIMWYVNVTDGNSWTNATYSFTTEPGNQTPPPIPKNITISTCIYEYTNEIQWTRTADTTLIRYDAGSAPTTRTEGHLLTNSTIEIYYQYGLDQNTKYHYTFWSYNITNNTYSDPVFYNCTTIANAHPTTYNECPLNGSIQDVDIAGVEIGIYDDDFEPLQYTIEGFWINNTGAINTSGGEYNASFITSLPYNSSIIWYVNVSDGNSWTNATYSFTTQKETQEPEVETDPALFVGASKAIIAGNLSDDGMAEEGECTTWFVWGTSPACPHTTEERNATNTSEFTEVLCGLEKDTTYFYRAVAKNSNATKYGEILNFTTVRRNRYRLNPRKIGVTNGSIFNMSIVVDVLHITDTIGIEYINFSQETLECIEVSKGSIFNNTPLIFTNGSIDQTNGTITDIVSASNLAEAGGTHSIVNITFMAKTNGSVSITVSGINDCYAGLGYDGNQSDIEINGSIQNKYIPIRIDRPENLTPMINITPVTNITTENITLNSIIEGDGFNECDTWFEWGASPSLGNATNVSGNKIENESATIDIESLQQGITYYYRAVTANSQGTNYSEIQTFSLNNTSPLEPSAIEVNSTTLLGKEYMSVYGGNISAYIADKENNSLNISYFFNGKKIYSENNTNNKTISINLSQINNLSNWYNATSGKWEGRNFLNHSTTYNWHIEIDDGTSKRIGKTYNFTTSHQSDCDESGRIYSPDVSTIVVSYGDILDIGGEIGADIDNSGRVYSPDISTLITEYGEITHDV